MAKVNHNITQNQYIYLLHSSMIGLGVLSIGGGVATTAHQSGWISVLLMGIYPIFLVLCSSYIDKKTGHIEYWEMSIKVYGKVLTYLFTFIFLIDFFLATVFALSGFTNVLLITITAYLPAKLVLFLLLLLSVFIAIDGLTYIGRLVELFFFLLVMLFLVPITFYHSGNIINMEPFFDSFHGILSALPSCIYPYIGIEIVFFITPFIVNPTSIKKAGIYACLFVIIVYTFVAFSVIYYAGWEAVSKMRLPLVFLLRTITIPIITDFKSIFVFLCGVIVFKMASTLYFGASYCSMKIFHMEYKKTCILLIPALYFIGKFFLIESKRRVFVEKASIYMAVFITVWAIATITIVYFKCRGDKFEKN